MRRMNKKVLFFFLLIFISSVCVNAEVEIDYFDRADSATVGNGWSETENLGSVAEILDKQLKMTDGITAGSYVDLIKSVSSNSNDTLNFQIKTSNTSNGEGRYIALRTSGTHHLRIGFNNDNIAYFNGAWTSVQSASSNTWYNISLKNINWGTDTYDIWIDGVEKVTGASFESVGSSFNEVRLRLDGDSISKELYFDNISYGELPPPPTPPVEEILESTLVRKQIANVTIGGSSFQTIISDVFNVSINNTPGYMSVASTLEGGSGTAECRILLDGNPYNSTVQRTLVTGQTGNLYSTSSGVRFANGSHTVAFQCRKVGGANYVVSNSIGIIHFQRDEQGEEINRVHVDFTNTTSSSSFQLLKSYNFLINDTSVIDGFVQSLVIDWGASYINNNGSALLNTYIEVIGYGNCSEYPRYVTAGSTGSVSGDCLFENVTPSENLTINVYGYGNNAEYDFSIHNKNFYVGIDEASTVKINSSSNRTDNFTLLFSSPINNTHHDNSNMFAKLTISTKGNISGTIEGYAKMIDGGFSQTTNVFKRSVGSEYGVAIFQWVFENVSQDNYSIEVYSRCVEGDCELDSVGTFISYMTDVTTTEVNAFNLTVLDNFDDSGIQGFNVSLDSTIITSATNNTLIFTTDELVNLTITTNYQGGYFPFIILNHNTSNDLNVSLNQTLISWNCVEKVSGNDLNCTTPSEGSVFNYNVFGNPHTQSLNVSGYFQNAQSFNVSPFDNETKDVEFYSSNVTLTVNSSITTPNGNCTFNITGVTIPSFSESVLGVPNSSIGLINGSYNVLVDCDGFAFNTASFIVENVTQTVNIELFTTNSVFLRFFDSTTRSSLNSTNVTVKFIGATSQTNISTTGELFVDLLNPSSYTILFSAPNYRQGSYIFTLDDRENVQIDLYLELENATQLALITVKDKFSKDPVQNAEVTIQKYIGDAWVTDQIVSTDFQGRSEAYFVLSTVFYNFLVEVDGVVFFGVINSDDNKKLIYAEDVAAGIVVEIDTTALNTVPNYQTIYDLITSMRFTETNNVSGFFIFTYDDTRNIARNATLNVYKEGVLFCTNNQLSESANMNCLVNVSVDEGEVLFTAEGVIDGFTVETYTARVGVDASTTLVWGAAGFIFGFLIVFISYLLFAKIPAMSVIVGTASFALLVLLKVIFVGMNLGLLVVFLFAAFLLAKIPSKSGVNA